MKHTRRISATTTILVLLAAVGAGAAEKAAPRAAGTRHVDLAICLGNTSPTCNE